MRKLRKLALPAVLALLTAPAAFAAAPARSYPERPIRFLIPFAPGGATDIVARMMGPKLSERLGQLKEAIAYVKERPGQLNYSAPLGSYSHLDMPALTAAAGIRMVHIPSKGAGETLPLLLRGDTHLTESNVASNIGSIRAGQLKAFAVTSMKRLAELPDVPTLSESGFPGIGSMNWNGMFVPARTPKPVVDKLFSATIAVMKEPEMQELFTKRAVPMALSESPAEFTAYVQSESRRWAKIIKDNNVRID